MFGSDLTFDPAGWLDAAHWRRSHPTSHIHLHAWTASAALGQRLFLSARLRLLAAKNPREGVKLNAAVSLLQL